MPEQVHDVNEYLGSWGPQPGDRGPWLGQTRVCRSCERETIEHLEDGWCWQCNHPGEDRNPGRPRVEIWRETAAHLRGMGFSEEAARWDAKIEAEGE